MWHHHPLRGSPAAPLAASSVADLCQQTAVALAGPVAAAQATLPTAETANADETRWPRPQAGRTEWLWVRPQWGYPWSPDW